MDVRPHPAYRLSTVTYLFDGAIPAPRQSGNRNGDQTGDVNLMTRGPRYCPFDASPEEMRPVWRDADIRSLQDLAALPDHLEKPIRFFSHTATTGITL